jgi:crossover junction endodeoxyribonuclease RusA
MTIIRLPWPSTKLSPNKSGQGKWREKTQAASSYKWECFAAIKDQKTPSLQSVGHVAVTFHPPSLRKYDLDNALARIKQGLDAVDDAIGVDDALWASMSLHRGHKVKGGCVIVRIDEALAAIPMRGTIE